MLQYSAARPKCFRSATAQIYLRSRKFIVKNYLEVIIHRLSISNISGFGKFANELTKKLNKVQECIVFLPFVNSLEAMSYYLVGLI